MVAAFGCIESRIGIPNPSSGIVLVMSDVSLHAFGKLNQSIAQGLIDSTDLW